MKRAPFMPAWILDVADCDEELDQQPSRAVLRRLVTAMVTRVLHPGHAGPLGGSVPGDPWLRRHGERP